MNRTPNDELIQAFAELKVLFPEWRLGQLVANRTTATGAIDPGAIWDIEDAQLLSAARRLIEQNQDRAAARV